MVDKHKENKTIIDNIIYNTLVTIDLFRYFVIIFLLFILMIIVGNIIFKIVPGIFFDSFLLLILMGFGLLLCAVGVIGLIVYKVVKQ